MMLNRYVQVAAQHAKLFPTVRTSSGNSIRRPAILARRSGRSRARPPNFSLRYCYSLKTFYLLAHNSQSPSAVGIIQPKTIRGVMKRKIVAIAVGLTVPLGKAMPKLKSPRLKRTAVTIHSVPSIKKKYAFISGHFFPLQ